MKMVFDLDGTLTDFNSFIMKNALPFFKNKYKLEVINKDALEIEDIFDIRNQLLKNNAISTEEAICQEKKMIKSFWFSVFFLKFSLGSRLRSGVKQYIKRLLKDGDCVEIHTSRAMTCKKNLAGRFAKMCTLMQLVLNGIPIHKVSCCFYENDEAKVNSIIEIKPDIVYDDKPEIIKELVLNDISCVCVKGTHNKDVIDSNCVKVIEDFSNSDLEDIVECLIGKKKYGYLKREAYAEKTWIKLSKIYPFVILYFRPVVLNKSNLIDGVKESVIYASNHQSTLDPLVITPIVNKSMHYVVLKRFMDGLDSIFNNNKNIVLRKFTANLFQELDLIPIERKQDNPNASNYKALNDLNGFLSIKSRIGIFPEGTTRKENGDFWGTFDDTFIRLAQKHDSWIQPITIVWKGTSKKIPIVNFGEAFKASNMTVEEAMQKYMRIQEQSYRECIK